MQLNTPMIIVRGPMGRDIAAFTVPADAWSFVSSKLNADALHYVRPDGQARRHADFKDAVAHHDWAVED